MARDYKWPDGKRIAVAVTAMLETWSDGKGPPYGVQASPLKPGATDFAGIAWGSYGGKVGVFRLIRLFKDNGIIATFAVNGRCAEIYPDAVKEIVASGHDVAGHAWCQDQLLTCGTCTPTPSTISIAARRRLSWRSPCTAISAAGR